MPTLSPEFIKAREDFASWYDSKTEDMQALIDEISDRTYFIIDEDEYDAFISELGDYGITDASSFECSLGWEGFTSCPFRKNMVSVPVRPSIFCC